MGLHGAVEVKRHSRRPRIRGDRRPALGWGIVLAAAMFGATRGGASLAQQGAAGDRAPLAAVSTPDGFTQLRQGSDFPVPERAPAASAVIRSAQAAARRSPGAFSYRRLADAFLAGRFYQQAAHWYRLESRARRQMGDANGAAVEERKARRWESQLVLYREETVAEPQLAAAPFEPASGCYLGAIVERDPRVNRDHAAFNALCGKDHALFYDYRSYGGPFPQPWISRLQRVGAGAQIAFEPNGGLQAVQDDRYLEQFARAAGASGVPIFLRFAGEMNGDWTHWSGNPALYREKWRLVHDVMRRWAPNVAMVWTPNAVPEETIAPFYPGDAYVDWVGVNFYTVHHHNNDLSQPADYEDPADQLRFVYDQYAARKPMMIAEYAATHFCKADGQELPRFAAAKLRALFAALPRRYPRVKAIHWYDIDNTTRAVRVGRDTNDYRLTDDETVLAAYRDAIRSPYYLSHVVASQSTGASEAPMVRYPPVAAGEVLSGTVRLSTWSKTFTDTPTVTFRLDGRPEAASNVRPDEVEWDTRRVADGAHRLEVTLFAGRRLVARTVLPVQVRNAGR